MSYSETPVARVTAHLRIGPRNLSIQFFDRHAPGHALVFVHGLGNSADNFAELLREPALAAHRLIALDLPGCGGAPYPERLGIDDLVGVFEAFVEHLGLRDFLLVGASLGGLVTLLYAERHQDRLSGFVNVEGNLASEDCLFSRLVVGHEYRHFEQVVLPGIKESLSRRTGRGFAKHLGDLTRASSEAYYDYSFQTVAYSDTGRLLDRFIGLTIPRYFIYGSANAHLSYLPRLRESACTLLEIPGADHFLFYDDPTAFAVALAGIVLDLPARL